MTRSLLQLIILFSFSASSTPVHFQHISPHFFRSYCDQSTIRKDQAVHGQKNGITYRSLGLTTCFLSLSMRSCIIHQHCSIAERDLALLLHTFLWLCNLHGNTMGSVKTSSKTAFQLFLKLLCWRNLFIGGDEAVGSFRTEDTDITINAQSSNVGLKYPQVPVYFWILLTGG